jgi:diacylglycerol kinase (ATP)
MISLLSRRFKSFTHAFRGAFTLCATQPNARIHLLATIVVLAAGTYFRVTTSEWMALCGAITLVWTAEALNTAIEFLADEVTLERKDRIKKAKDVAAFGVLAAAIGAVAIGALVFVPHFHLW